MSRSHHARGSGRIWHGLGLPNLKGCSIVIDKNAWLTGPGSRRWARHEVSHARRRAGKAEMAAQLNEMEANDA